MVAITGVCSGRKKKDMQSLSTRDPNVEEIIFICVLGGTLYLRGFGFNGIRHKSREVVITKPVTGLPQQFILNDCSCVYGESKLEFDMYCWTYLRYNQ